MMQDFNQFYVKKEDINKKSVLNKIEKKLGFPCFIKPANAGSSVGITKAHNREEAFEGLKLAVEHDKKVIVERNINGREVECAVLGSGKGTKASGVGEILAAAEFYDYDAKYNNAESRTVIPADLDEKTVEEIRKTAIKVFNAVSGEGLARVDFFVENETGKVIFNELNTLPGFTSISMYPKLWEEAGKPITELIDELLEMAFNRF